MIDLIHKFIIPAAYLLLPANMSSDESTAMLLAIGLQESRLKYREQIGGPAHGFWQFEKGGGIIGVLTHPSSRPHLLNVLSSLQYRLDISPDDLYHTITHNDILAASCARLLLWTDFRPMPKFNDGPEAAWKIYNSVWRPGKPHMESWDAFHSEAWKKVKEL